MTSRFPHEESLGQGRAGSDPVAMPPTLRLPAGLRVTVKHQTTPPVPRNKHPLPFVHIMFSSNIDDSLSNKTLSPISSYLSFAGSSYTCIGTRGVSPLSSYTRRIVLRYVIGLTGF